MNSDSLPREVIVKALVSSRYPNKIRPLSWDERKAGVDTILTIDGETLSLLSDGQQSPPKPGWILILTQKSLDGFSWTLYGVPRGAGTDPAFPE